MYDPIDMKLTRVVRVVQPLDWNRVRMDQSGDILGTYLSHEGGFARNADGPDYFAFPESLQVQGCFTFESLCETPAARTTIWQVSWIHFW